MERATTEFEKEVFMYLNDLRDSGVTNMYGASPYIAEVFDVSKATARDLLKLWMKNFSKSGNYAVIKV